MAESLALNIQFELVFKEYAKFGNANKGDGTKISLSNSDKWLKEAGVLDGKKISSTDTAIIFTKTKQKTLDFKQYIEFLQALAKECKMNYEDLQEKLMKCGAPKTTGATTSSKSGVVNRLTDTSKYTGSHKERFDKSGKGKGKSGREDAQENDGYVSAYKEKHKDTYDKTKKK